MIELRNADGEAYRGWTEASASSSLEDMASTFSFRQSLTDDGLGLDVYAGAACEVWADNTPVISGWIDEIAPRLNKDGRELSVNGRSRTSDLVDNDAPVQTYKRVTLAKLADILAAPYGVGVIDLAGDTHVFGRVRPAPGESISEVLLRLARQRGLLLTDDETGALVIMRATAPAASSTEIRMGSNVLEMDGRVSIVGRYKTYEVRGQALGETAALTDSTAIVTDTSVVRARRRIIKPEHPVDQAGARALAEWEAVTRAGRAQEATYTLSGWYQDDGTPWRTGVTVPIWDPMMRLAGQRWLVVGRELKINKDGRKTALRVQPPEAFLPYVYARPAVTQQSKSNLVYDPLNVVAGAYFEMKRKAEADAKRVK